MTSNNQQNFVCNVEGNDAQFAFCQLLGSSVFAKAELYTVQRQVVLKTVNFNNEIYKSNPGTIQAAIREAKLISRLSHPNIVRIYHAWRDPSKNCLLMEQEFCSGGTLQRAISDQQGKAFPEQQIKNWVAQISVAIAYIHDLGIAHRNLSSDNVLLSGDKKVAKVSGFGMARIHEISLNLLTNSMSELLRNQKYAAPETGDPELKNNRFTVDVWALGVVAFEIATLDSPSHSFANLDQHRIYELVRNVQPTALRDLIATKLLVKGWNDRATMVEVIRHEFVADVAAEIGKDHSDYLHDQIIELKNKAVESRPGSSMSLTDPEPKPVKGKYIQEIFELDSVEQARQLVERNGADVNAKNQQDKWGGNALYYAAEKGDLAIVKYLLDCDCNIDDTDQDGATPLMVACEYGRIHVARLLLEHGANVDAIDHSGRTPLIWSAANDHDEIVRMILYRNPQTLNHMNKDGKTALQRAQEEGNISIVDLLMQKGAE